MWQFRGSRLGEFGSNSCFVCSATNLIQAWNLRLRSSTRWQPSAEFVEGFLFFLYGSTNIFLEHLGNAGKPFSHQDLEHVAITVLFIGGGLVRFISQSIYDYES